MGDFVTAYVSDVFNGAELQGFADGHMDPAFVEQVQNMEGVEKLLPLYVFENSIQAGKTVSPCLLYTSIKIETNQPPSPPEGRKKTGASL